MSCIINASNSSGLTFSSDLSGSIQLQQNGVNLPALSVAPAFSAYVGTNQTITAATYTAIQCNTEFFDTNSNYDTSTYRFTPTVAGYYQVNGSMQLNAGTSITRLITVVYKNGVLDTYGTDIAPATTAVTLRGLFSSLIYMNGTTDYLNFYGYATGTGTLTITSSSTKWSASLARGA